MDYQLLPAHQLINPTDSIFLDFTDTGIFIEILSTNTTRLIITAESRNTRLGEASSNILKCQCTGFRDLNRGEVTRTVSITTYNRPDPPGNLNLVSTAMGLTLVWDRPSNAPPPLVSTNYTLSIFNVTDSGNVMYLDSAMTTTSFSIHFLEESLLGMPCQRFQFLVTADNDAGVGSPAIYNETVPVSANTSDIDATLRLVFLNLGSENDTSFTMQFRTVNSCSMNFPVLDYTINVNFQPILVVSASDVAPLTLINVTVNSSITPLPHNMLYLISVTVRSAVSQRVSRSQRIQTTDVQSAAVIFHQTYVQLSCRLADVTQSLGCLFQFSPNTNGTGQQEFILMREGGGVTVSQCNDTINQRSAYRDDGRISVFDIENNGSVSDFRIGPVTTEIVGMTNFTMATGCEIPIDIVVVTTPTNVAAIVVPIVVILLLATLLVTVIMLVWCKIHRKNTKKLLDQETRADELEVQNDGFKQEIEVQKTRKLSMTAESGGIYSVEFDTGGLIDKIPTISPSASTERDLSSSPPTPTSPTGAAGGPPFPGGAAGGPPFPDTLNVPEGDGTGSTGSYSPKRPRIRPEVKRSFSEGSPGSDQQPLLGSTVSRGAIQLRFRKGSLELKVHKEQLLEEIRRRSKPKISLRSRSISHDPSASKEDTAPLLMTYSELHFSNDMLDIISEGSLEDIREESWKVDQGTPTFQLGSALASSNNQLKEQDSPLKKGIKGATGQDESSF
ncbi:uncharacterized protein LOC135344964 isoform X2 [Halichondria panicea]|uniref:uncharacterized protein LOC135344964 isoform X2 n=2 Tax=Halichondria panicea TaxID=6063 RepID=UPI00312B925A